MSNTVNLNIPTDSATRVRQSVIRDILKDLVSHQMTMDEAVKALDHLAIASRVRHDRAPVPSREFNGGDTPPIPYRALKEHSDE